MRPRYPGGPTTPAVPTPPRRPPVSGALRGLWAALASRLPGRPPSEDPDDLPAAALDAVPDPVLIVDAGDRIRAANRAVREVLGYPPDALVGVGFAEAFLPLSARDGHRERLRQWAEAPDVQVLPAPERLAVRCADGSEAAVEATVRLIDPARPLFGVHLRDARAWQAADDRRRTLRTIVDALPHPVVAVDRAFRVILRNRASLDEVGDGPAPPLSADWRRRADAVMRSGAPDVDREEAVPGAGVRHETQVPVRDRSGAVVGLVAISRDVTAQKEAEERLLADMRAAEAAAEANREFLATTSHEVRTLMSGVTGMTTLLLDTGLDDEQREFVDTIRTSSGALLAVINDVLDFSKMESGMLALEDEPFDVRRVVAESLRLVAQQAAAKGLAASAAVDLSVPDTVWGDAGRVRQVLANLLSNAVKFTEAGSVRVAAQVAPPGDDGRPRVAFAVADTGVGIAPDRLDAVFERFTQADASTARTHGGTGLGLSICRRLVEMMGGSLSAESEVGAGSVFRFTVAAGPAPEAPGEPVWISRPATPTHAPAPQAPADPPPTAAPPSAPAPPTAARDGGPGRQAVLSTDAILPSARVLIAEDNPVNQKVAALTLRRLGYQPDIVDDGAKAVAAVRARPYDLVLMDVMMPNMTGLEATRAIREDPGPHPPPAIVALTANALDGDRQRCLDAGCDDYLSKPAAPALLAATIERAIRERTAVAA